MSPQGRELARGLSGYLCGTHSGLLALSSSGKRTPGARSPKTLVKDHRNVDSAVVDGFAVELGSKIWESNPSSLARSLDAALTHPGVIDLILFGSQAGGRTTGFSDVDAILVISDEIAGDPTEMPSLRRSVLAAQRVVIRYQPMQHHGFEIVTPKLLLGASDALALPAVALAETRSLRGHTLVAFAHNDRAPHAGTALRAVARSVLASFTWPRHPWELHRLIAMFELLPTLYVQSRHKAVPKSSSFAEARADFTDSWWPYDVLNEIRTVWPRTRRPLLEVNASLVRNPWVSIAIWRRLPGSVPQPVRPYLTPRLLDGLHALVRAMAD